MNLKDCVTCRLWRADELLTISRWMRAFYQNIVDQERAAVGRYIFDKYPRTILTRGDDEGAYAVQGYEMNVPFMLGGLLHRLFEQHDKIDAELWHSQGTFELPCVLCKFENDCLAHREMPSTFLLKNHHYYCPTLITIDNRRPHPVAGKMSFSYESKLYSEEEEPALGSYEFRLRSLGNAAFYPSACLFPRLLDRLFLNSLNSSSPKKNPKRRLKDLQTCINTGSVERAVLPQPKRYQQRYDTPSCLREIQITGYHANTKRYKDVLVANDFNTLVSPYECVRIVTCSANDYDFRTVDETEIGFLDPCFTCDGTNVGKVVALTMRTLVSFQRVDGKELMRFLEEWAGKHQSVPSSQLLIVINGGELVRRVDLRLRDVQPLRVAFKDAYGLVEVLAFGKPDVRLITISTLPYICYALSRKRFYSPAESNERIRRWYWISSLFTLPIPFPNHNHGPKNAYVAAAMRQVAQILPPSRIRYLASSHTWSLAYPQTPFIDNRQSFPLYVINVKACVMCVDGFNQEDGLVLNKSAVDRGMFLTTRYGNYRVAFDPGARVTLVTNAGAKLTVGTCLARITDTDVIKTYNVELKVKSRGRTYEVSWNEEKISPKLHSITVDASSVLRIVVSTMHDVAVGDKLMSSTGQKGVVTAVLLEIDLPFVRTKQFEGVPDLFIHPNFLKRQTAAVVLEGVNRYDKRVPFPYMDYAFSHNETQKLLETGQEFFTGPVYRGATGKNYENVASIYELSYHILPQHCAIEKCYATNQLSLRARDPLTGQLRKGKSHFGAAGLSSMDVDALLGHGSTTTLSRFMFNRADDVILKDGDKDPVRLGASMTRYLDDQRLMNLEMNVEICPKVTPL